MKTFKKQVISGILVALTLLLTLTLYEANQHTTISNKPAVSAVAQALEAPQAVEPVAEPTPAPTPAVEPSEATVDVVKANPNGCNQDTQWILPSGECKDKAVPAPPKSVPTVSITGNKQEWLQASGIPADLWWAVDYIVSRESGWNPCAYYPGRSNCSASPTTACGLAQQNPCGKIPGHWTDPVAALRWQYQYVNDRYGGYPQAVAYWKIHHVY